MAKRKGRVFLFGIGSDAWQREYGRHFSEAMGGRKVKPARKPKRRAQRRRRS